MPRRNRNKSYTIFISHSTKDRWIARQMSRLIEEKVSKYYARTFLDERDIAGGESINDTIKENLRSCDEFLILLTKNSIDRPWVLIELGGAWFGNKVIVPIIDKITPEEMPDVIAQNKAIELNDFDNYLKELILRLRKHKGNRK
ncbi:MAG: toll/interleukin-1 receptor domain-containing protein [Ignavibacteriae bacterium]|nr:toll/interleukin-1 receptor domain-containing protein [Ignavibacteriota bacterium]